MSNYIIITEPEAWALVDALGIVIDDMDHEFSADLHERVIPLLQGVQGKLYKAFNIVPVEGEGPFSHEVGPAADPPGNRQQDAEMGGDDHGGK